MAEQQKTPVPIPFVEEILPGQNILKGKIGQLDPVTNRFIPEPNAYIYIYLNGFLINPPEPIPEFISNSVKSYKNSATAVVSDKNGLWYTTNFIFDILGEFKKGQTVIFRGKSPYKTLSDRSVPYVIGGAPTPVDLGVRGEYGVLRPPFEGEDFVTGRLSYWFTNSAPVVPILDCNNEVYVYIDGFRAGSDIKVANGAKIPGQVLRNYVIGDETEYPIPGSLDDLILGLYVQGSLVEVPLINTTTTGSVLFDDSVNGTLNGSNNVFSVNLPPGNPTLILYRNGLRLSEGVDYTLLVDLTTKIATITFDLLVVPEPGDALKVEFRFNPQDITVGETPATTATNNIFTLAELPLTNSVRLFLNGLRLNTLNPAHVGFSDNNIVFSAQIPDPVNDLLKADYQPSDAEIQYFFTVPVNGVKDGANNTFTFAVPQSGGTVSLYRNGLLQNLLNLAPGDPIPASGSTIFYDGFIINNTITFNLWAIPQPDDELIIDYTIAPAASNDVITYLNNTSTFIDNCLRLERETTQVQFGSVTVQGSVISTSNIFTLPASNIPVILRGYKNGLRQKQAEGINTNDFSYDSSTGKVTLTYPRNPDDLILFEYIYGSGLAATQVTPSGAMDSSNTVFTLPELPMEGTVQLFRNGLRLNPNATGSGQDYSVLNNQITLLNPSAIPDSGDNFFADYQPFTHSVKIFSNLAVSGVQNGVNRVFTITVPTAEGTVSVFLNGLKLKQDLDYTRVNNTITFDVFNTPQATDAIVVDYDASPGLLNTTTDRLILSSPYTLELASGSRYDAAHTKLFGTPQLYPGKDSEGNFLFYIDRKTGYWKFTNYKKLDDTVFPPLEYVPFARMQHITARALNTTPISLE